MKFTAKADLWSMTDNHVSARSIVVFQKEIMERAVKVFLKAMLRKIPYRTGFLKGSFRALRDRFLKKAQLNPLLAALFQDHETIDEDSDQFNPKRMFFDIKKEVAAAEKRIEKSQGKSYGEQVKKARQHDRDLFRKKKKSGVIPIDMRYREFYYHGKGRAGRIVKTPSSGVPFVTPPDQVLVTSGERTTVTIANTIRYFQVNDNFSKVRGGPWRAMEAGFLAMTNYIELKLREYPLLDELLLTERIVLEGDKVSKRTVANYRNRMNPRVGI